MPKPLKLFKLLPKLQMMMCRVQEWSLLLFKLKWKRICRQLRKKELNKPLLSPSKEMTLQVSFKD
jgi:hypothetical protein